MKNSLYILPVLTLLLLSASSLAQNKADKQRISREIEEMFEKDQQYRRMIMYGETDEKKIQAYMASEDRDKIKRIREVLYDTDGSFTALKDSLWAMQHRADIENYEQLATIIRSAGYPAFADKVKVSTILLHNSYALADSDLLALLKQQVKEKRMDAMEYALVYDRMQLELGRSELYFVAAHTDDTGKAIFKNPVDIEATNNARKEIGLKPLKKKD